MYRYEYLSPVNDTLRSMPSLVCLTLGTVNSKGSQAPGPRVAIGFVWAEPIWFDAAKSRSKEFGEAFMKASRAEYNGGLAVN